MPRNAQRQAIDFAPENEGMVQVEHGKTLRLNSAIGYTA
jgi:hypothetical protein